MASKYVDTTAIMQVIGCVYNNPSLLDMDDKYHITDEDFPDDFHRIVFGSIYKLHELGAEKITLANISDYLASRPKSGAIYKKEKGEEWLLKVSQSAMLDAFDYYYNRLKKFTLLRMFDYYGIDITDIYDPDNIIDTKKAQMQEEYIDSSSLADIANKVNEKIEIIREKYVDQNDEDAAQAGEGIFDLIESFKEHPEVGVPLYGNLINTVTRGARLKKFYLRSAPTGVGKTRAMIADACQIGCKMIYDETAGGWVENGVALPVLYITTEQELEEVQTMMLAFLSNVNEDHILNGKYYGDEWMRVKKAADILIDSPIYIEELPDFSLKDVEDTIKKNIREHNVLYVFDFYKSWTVKNFSCSSAGVLLM